MELRCFALKKQLKRPVRNKCADVPVVMQMQTLECGAACLAMILAYYGKWLPPEQVRLACGVSRDGSNAKNIVKAAQNYGLSVKAYRYEPKELREKGSFPCIVHWNFNHFVVVNGFKEDKVLLNDPEKGSCRVSMEEFDRCFTGVCLSFQPNEEFQTEGKRKSMFSFAVRQLQGTGSAIVFVALTTLILSVIGVLRPVMSRVFLDRLLTGKNPEWIPAFFLLLFLFVSIQITVTALQSVYSFRINGKLAAMGNTSYMWKVLCMPMEFFSQRMSGDIQQRKGINANLSSKLIDIFAPLILNITVAVCYLVVMLRYSVLLTVIGAASILLNLGISYVISKKRINITRVQMRDRANLTGVTVSGIEMIETIKVGGIENAFFERWANHQASVNRQQVRYTKLNQYFGILPSLVLSLSNLIVLFFGVSLILKGQFSVGMVMAFQGFLSGFYTPATTLIESGQSLQEMRTEMERLEDVMEYPSENRFKDFPIEAEYGKLQGNIEMRNVTFGYSPLEEPLIRNFNLNLHTGDRVAIVGASGCGKSTISKLISGLYQAWDGEILFDGKPMEELDKNVFNGSLAVVDQDIILFEDTIENNIKMWDTSIEDFEMIIAARDAQIHEEIVQREGGYQYRITEGGKDFSGGQRQCMEIARVLAQDPTMIILDEATSALDAKTEHRVIDAIKARGITCIVIAHRLSTIKDCDEIIVLDGGKVAERGTHQELYEKKGLYTRLIDMR